MPFLTTHSGKHFCYKKISSENIVIEDIAHALSNICRFAGHLSSFYSVAQHSVYTSFLVPKSQALEALLHDASEAYCVDIPAPLKRLLPDYRRIENRVDAAIREKFMLPISHDPQVKQADLIMLATERRDLGIDDGTPWPCLDTITPTDQFKIEPMPPKHAEIMFLARFSDLTSQADLQRICDTYINELIALAGRE
ncbi:HD domain-containing protein [Klebsiella oxytoca]|uniref:HD family hydrolase n=1 Tax=Klebsiella oxytoca TaxID=571 RepID=UPI0022473AB6|nr:HD family hydrolase [Klebsiella oxytoca]MCW9548062.1 HD family hydrolase [Klebsiella oxytoca]